MSNAGECYYTNDEVYGEFIRSYVKVKTTETILYSKGTLERDTTTISVFKPIKRRRHAPTTTTTLT